MRWSSVGLRGSSPGSVFPGERGAVARAADTPKPAPGHRPTSGRLRPEVRGTGGTTGVSGPAQQTVDRPGSAAAPGWQDSARVTAPVAVTRAAVRRRAGGLAPEGPAAEPAIDWKRGCVVTIEGSEDKKTLTISLRRSAYKRLDRRAAARDQTVDQYVFDLVVRNAYAVSGWERLRKALPAWCCGLALALLFWGYLTHTDGVLLIAPVLLVLAWAPLVCERIARRRRRGDHATSSAGQPGAGS